MWRPFPLRDFLIVEPIFTMSDLSDLSDHLSPHVSAVVGSDLASLSLSTDQRLGLIFCWRRSICVDVSNLDHNQPTATATVLLQDLSLGRHLECVRSSEVE